MLLPIDKVSKMFSLAKQQQQRQQQQQQQQHLRCHQVFGNDANHKVIKKFPFITTPTSNKLEHQAYGREEKDEERFT